VLRERTRPVAAEHETVGAKQPQGVPDRRAIHQAVYLAVNLGDPCGGFDRLRPAFPSGTQVIEDDTGNFFALTRVTIDAAGVARQILRGEDGAFVNFEGVVRNNTKGRATKFLDYECYEAMAVKMMAEIGRDIVKNHAIGRIAILHRLGRMEIGETSVAVIATAPHRKPAFEAALEGINRLKKTVPIWKKEYFVDGEVWVDGEWDDDIVRAGSAQL